MCGVLGDTPVDKGGVRKELDDCGENGEFDTLFFLAKTGMAGRGAFGGRAVGTGGKGSEGGSEGGG